MDQGLMTPGMTEQRRTVVLFTPMRHAAAAYGITETPSTRGHAREGRKEEGGRGKETARTLQCALDAQQRCRGVLWMHSRDVAMRPPHPFVVP